VIKALQPTTGTIEGRTKHSDALLAKHGLEGGLFFKHRS